MIVIAGPTASGKTDVAIQLAQQLNTEIISADSRQCYIELNIGVAKPSHTQLNTVKHHFINSHHIHQHVTAADFEIYASDVLNKIFLKNDYAILVGGTGLYIKALCEGLDPMPAIDPSIHDKIQSNYQLYGIEWLQDQIKKDDPLFYEQGEIQNPHRLIRALVFVQSHNQSIIHFQQHIKKKRPYAIDYYAVKSDRSVLYDRINKRVEDMFANGLEAEVRNLQAYLHLKNLQTVGYQEFIPYFEGCIHIEEVQSKIQQHTRQYAKRQITWFTHQGSYIWKSIPELVLTPC